MSTAIAARFEGAPPCNKLHCEWLFEHSKQTAKEIEALKARLAAVTLQVTTAVQERAEAQQLCTSLEARARDAESKLDAEAAAATAARDTLTQLAGTLKKTQAMNRQLEQEAQGLKRQLADWQRTESPRSQQRKHVMDDLTRSLNTAKQTEAQLKGQLAASKSVVAQASEAVSAILAVCGVTDGSASSESSSVLDKLKSLEKWVRAAIASALDQQQAIHSLQQQAQAQLASRDDLQRQCLAQDQAIQDAMDRSKAMEERITGLMQELDGRRAEAAAGVTLDALLAATNRAAMFEKSAMEAAFTIQSLQRTLLEQQDEVAQLKSACQQKDVTVELLERRMRSQQTMLDAVMAAREADRTSEVTAVAAKVEIVEAERKRVLAMLDAKTGEVHRLQELLRQYVPPAVAILASEPPRGAWSGQQHPSQSTRTGAGSVGGAAASRQSATAELREQTVATAVNVLAQMQQLDESLERPKSRGSSMSNRQPVSTPGPVAKKFSSSSSGRPSKGSSSSVLPNLSPLRPQI